MGYAGRGIHSADVWSFNKVVLDNNVEGISTTVLMHLEGREDPTALGPEARFDFAFECSSDQTLEQVEDKALEIAVAFMRRLGSMSVEELKARVSIGRENALMKPSN